MNIRSSCPICSSIENKIIFSFNYDYLLNVLNIDEELLKHVSFKKDSVSNIVMCAGCSSSYIREDFEIDQYFDSFFEINKAEFEENDRSNMSQGSRKTWGDKLMGKEYINNTILSILTTYSKKEYYSPIPEKPIKLLDFGCGWGNWLKSLSHYNFIDSYGYDINKFKINSLCQLGINAFSDMDEIRKIGSFDVIICNDVIEHTEDPKQIIEVLGSLLKSQGILYAAVPLFSSKDMIKASFKMQNRKRLKHFHLGHINYLTPAAYKSTLISYGFKPTNSQASSMIWSNGAIKSNLIGLLKFVFKVISYRFTSKYTNIWIKS